MAIFRFDTRMRCHLQNGETTLLRREIEVDADTLTQARGWLHSVAEETVHDEGSRWLDAPLDYLEITDFRRVG